MLAKLPPKYCDNYTEWLYITTIFKNLAKKELWDKWSKPSKNYNKENNFRIWNYNQGNININFLFTIPALCYMYKLL